MNARFLLAPRAAAAAILAAFTLFSVQFCSSACASAQTSASPSTSPDTASIGPYYALVIGNDDYRTLPKLKTATSDAIALAAVLRERFGFSTSLLLNATRSDIIAALLTYRRTLPEKSSLLIYYAGHGANDSEAKVAYWLPVDAERGNTTNWISSEDITSELRVIKALHILVVADSCYSGALMRGVDLIDVTAELKPSERDFYIEKLQSLKSRNLIASGGVEPVADGGTLNHSIFAAVLLQSLVEMQETEFTSALLFQKLVVRVAGRSRQTPQYSPIVNSEHDGGDFVFVHQPASAAPPSLCCSPHPVPAAASDARLVPTPLAPAPASAATSNGALGRWVQPLRPDSKGLAELTIALNGDAVTMRAHAFCANPVCDWGTQTAVFDGRNTTATFTLKGRSTAPRTAKITVHPVAGGLDVLVDNIATGTSGTNKRLVHRTFVHPAEK